MPKQPRKPTTNTERETHLYVAALEKENLRLQKAFLKEKAQNVSLRHALALRPPFQEPERPVLNWEAVNAVFATAPKLPTDAGHKAA